MIAALYVETGGVYFGLPDVDPWDEQRDARLYAGPWPVVAHPPCSSWCQIAFVNQKRYGHKVGDDGGCFAAALAAVRRWGGVLEHPAMSYAWLAFGLPVVLHGSWRRDLLDGGWVTEVHQTAYGHRARKRTWLYYVGDAEPPALDWSSPEPTATVSYLTNHGGLPRPRLTKKQAKATPPAFRDLLLSLARSAQRGGHLPERLGGQPQVVGGEVVRLVDLAGVPEDRRPGHGVDPDVPEHLVARAPQLMRGLAAVRRGRLVTTGSRVTLVRLTGASGPLLDACLGKTGTVVEVYERAGKTVLRVRFGDVGWQDNAVWSLKPEEVEPCCEPAADPDMAPRAKNAPQTSTESGSR